MSAPGVAQNLQPVVGLASAAEDEVRSKDAYLIEGTPLDPSDIDAFWSFVAKSARWKHPTQPSLGPCWFWRGSRDRKGRGYGHFYAKDRTFRAHRLSYALVHGDAKQWVLHSCDRPNCVNPAHLYDGSPKDNAQDCHKRQRARRRPTKAVSGYRGVTEDRLTHKWRAAISVQGTQVRLGLFATPEQAARAYDAAAFKYQAAAYGIGYVRFNFPEEWQ